MAQRRIGAGWLGGALALLVSAAGLGLGGGQQPAAADVTSVAGSAFGYRLQISLFGGPTNTRGFGQVACTNPPSNNLPTGCAPSPAASSSPSVVLPPAGGNVSQSDPDGAVGSYGPATVFSTGSLNVSSVGTTGPTGSVTTSASLGPLNTSGQEHLNASGVSSTCTASAAGPSGSTTITAGALDVDNGDDVNGDGDYTDPGEHPPVVVPVPVNPAPNTTYLGHIHVNGAPESFRYVFNEQVVNPDGSLTVNAGHQYLLGPTAVGELVFGQVVCGATSPTSRFTPVSPARVWDSRSGPGPVGRVGAGQSRAITVTGANGVPASGVSAVVLNVTAVNPTAATFITVWPTGEAKPLASNLNVPPNDVRPNLVIVKVGAGGQVTFANDAGTVNLIADIAGYYSASGSSFTSVSPFRVWDSRSGPGPVGAIGPAGTRDLTVTGTGGVPATGVTAVVLNVTAVNPTAATFITVWPTGEAKPLASNLNVPPDDVRPNLVVVKVGAGGKVSFANDAGSVNLIADVAGWYGLPGA